MLFITMAEHELNPATAAMRHMTSTMADVYTSLSGALTALSGSRYGGSVTSVLAMLEDIGDVTNVAKFIQAVKNEEKELFGFGHTLYKSVDPRAKIMRKIAIDVITVTGPNKVYEVAMELENVIRTDSWFKNKALMINADFFPAVIYKALAIPSQCFTVLYAIPRFAGWMAHWNELVADENAPLCRPRQVYNG